MLTGFNTINNRCYEIPGWGDLPDSERRRYKMLTKDRSVFVYTLEDDERKCLASIEKIDQMVKERICTRRQSLIK